MNFKRIFRKIKRRIAKEPIDQEVKGDLKSVDAENAKIRIYS